MKSDVLAVLSSSQLRSSSVSVVFDFNASLSDVAPASPILLAVDMIYTKRVFDL